MFSVPLSETKITKTEFWFVFTYLRFRKDGIEEAPCVCACVKFQLDSWRLKFKWQFCEYGWWIIWKFWQLIVRSVSLSLRSAIECSFCLTSDIQEVCLRTVRTEASKLENFSRENLSYNFISFFSREKNSAHVKLSPANRNTTKNTTFESNSIQKREITLNLSIIQVKPSQSQQLNYRKTNKFSFHVPFDLNLSFRRAIQVHVKRKKKIKNKKQFQRQAV